MFNKKVEKVCTKMMKILCVWKIYFLLLITYSYRYTRVQVLGLFLAGLFPAMSFPR